MYLPTGYRQAVLSLRNRATPASRGLSLISELLLINAAANCADIHRASSTISLKNRNPRYKDRTLLGIHHSAQYSAL